MLAEANKMGLGEVREVVTKLTTLMETIVSVVYSNRLMNELNFDVI